MLTTTFTKIISWTHFIEHPDIFFLYTKLFAAGILQFLFFWNYLWGIPSYKNVVISWKKDCWGSSNLRRISSMHELCSCKGHSPFFFSFFSFLAHFWWSLVTSVTFSGNPSNFEHNTKKSIFLKSHYKKKQRKKNQKNSQQKKWKNKLN